MRTVLFGFFPNIYQISDLFSYDTCQE